MQTRTFATALLVQIALLALSAPTLVSASPSDTRAENAKHIEEIAARWIGSYNNHRQVRQSEAWGPPSAPELTREKRELKVERLNAPQLGSTVLYFEEYRATVPGLAHRQRVVSLVWDDKLNRARAIQFFFSPTLSYDRTPKPATQVEKLKKSDFYFVPGCDLIFNYQSQHKRWHAAMAPRQCEYDHPGSGRVFAEFDFYLLPDQHWYRDRSIKIADGSIRGEIDGFSWLTFDRLDGPINAERLKPLLEQAGTWKGTFTRVGANGKIEEQFPSTIVVKVGAVNDARAYFQTNTYMKADGKVEVLESIGRIEVDRVRFDSPQISGFSAPITDDPTRRTSLLYAKFKVEKGPMVGVEMFELITLAPDGKSRVRDTQFMRGGQLLRRTIIDEQKVE